MSVVVAVIGHGRRVESTPVAICSRDRCLRRVSHNQDPLQKCQRLAHDPRHGLPEIANKDCRWSESRNLQSSAVPTQSKSWLRCKSITHGLSRHSPKSIAKISSVLDPG